METREYIGNVIGPIGCRYIHRNNGKENGNFYLRCTA